MNIRFATTTDSFSIFRLLVNEAENKTNEELKEGNYYKKWEPLFRETVNNNSVKIFVAVDNEIVVGVTTVYLLPRLELAGKYAVVEDVFVKTDERSKGIGTALFTHIIDFLKQEKVKHISAVIDPNCEQVKLFYGKLGFVSNGQEMRLALLN